MKQVPVAFAALFAVSMVAIGPAKAQSASPQQIQGLIANGQEQNALADLQSILQQHPDSGVAWYLTAEAQDASGNEGAARSALANAQHYAPGLPFAQPAAAAALESHLNNAPVARHSAISPALVGIIFLVIVFLGLRMLFRRRRYMAPGYPSYGQGQGMPGGMPPGPYPYGPGPGMGSGLGGSLLGGLAAGAGFAAGERVIDDMFGRNNDPMNGNQQDPNFGNGVPDRDDGLSGNSGWDNSSNNQDDSFDPGNSW